MSIPYGRGVILRSGVYDEFKEVEKFKNIRDLIKFFVEMDGDNTCGTNRDQQLFDAAIEYLVKTHDGVVVRSDHFELNAADLQNREFPQALTENTKLICGIDKNPGCRVCEWHIVESINS